MRMKTCEEISRDISESLDSEISIWRKLKIFIHLRFCCDCRNFKQNLLCLNKLVKNNKFILKETDYTNKDSL